MLNLYNNFFNLNFSSFSQHTKLFFSTTYKNTYSNLTPDLSNNSIIGFPSNQFYENTDTDKLDIFQDNKGKAGIYIWSNKKSGKFYVGSSIDLSIRFSSYYSLPYLIRRKSSYICNALLKDGYSNFSLTILEYIDISNLSKDQAKNLILEREQYYFNILKPPYNILAKAGSSLGYKHSEESISRMSDTNNPMFGKTGNSHPTSKKVYLYKLDPDSKNLILDKSFNTCTDAAKHFSCSIPLISKYLKSGKLFKGKWILSLISIKDSSDP
jgi:hypothetical protein